MQGENAGWGSRKKACRIYILEAVRERKAGCDSRSQRVCGEQTVKGAYLESLFASSTRAVIAAMACIQGGHPLVTMSSCFDICFDIWEPRCLLPTDIEVPGPVLGWNGQKERMVWCDLADGGLAAGGGSG